MGTIAILKREDDRVVCKHLNDPIGTLALLKTQDFFQEKSAFWAQWDAVKPGRVRPGDNGFVFADFDRKHLLNGQTLSPLKTFVVGIDPAEHVRGLFQSKRITSAQGIFDGSIKKRLKIPASATYEDFLQIAQQVMGSSTMGSFLLHLKTPKGWNFSDLNMQDPGAWQAFFNMITDLNCKFTGSDINAWKQRLKLHGLSPSIADLLTAHTQATTLGVQTLPIQKTRKSYRL